MPSCYLTIDDSPSPHTDEMIDFLVDRNIPALLFCRGDFIEQNPAPIIRAIQKGFVIGNHSYAHKPYGDLTYNDAIADINKCEIVIDQCYKSAAVEKPGNYFRFPYLDRGNGDRIERHFEKASTLDINKDDRVLKIQKYLKDHGYHQPFHTTHPLYNNASIETAADCLMTYTSFDWMLTGRHKGKWDYKDIDGLKRRIDNDITLKTSDGNILIFHDQPEILPVFKSLIDHMLSKGYEFLPIK